ncbi:MAG: hypothetical protein CM1200mP15_19450 [Dehalococcoidia bacterium]|nr:MAG: hypothetical protein CM1200mP15_19450 [Dehalococcoidia bacterium]
MAIMSFISDIRNAAIANAVIVVFHIYIAFAVEGVGFLIIALSDWRSDCCRIFS